METSSKTVISSVSGSFFKPILQCLRFLTKTEVMERRLDLFHVINGDAFFPLQVWPQDMKRIFWSKPHSDLDTFKIMLFAVGNGCSPCLISEWILLAISWAPDKAEKRARQIDYILANVDGKANKWFYYDLDYRKWLLLNGFPRWSWSVNRKRWHKSTEQNVQKGTLKHLRNLLNRLTQFKASTKWSKSIHLFCDARNVSNL